MRIAVLALMPHGWTRCSFRPQDLWARRWMLQGWFGQLAETCRGLG